MNAESGSTQRELMELWTLKLGIDMGESMS